MSDLDRVHVLVGLMREQQRKVELTEAELAVAKAALRRTECEDLPELMTELALTELTLRDGAKLSISPEVQVGISEERMPAAVAWLEGRGFAGIVKTALSVEFDAGEGELAAEAAEALGEVAMGHDVTLRQRIHPQTLLAFVKERMRAGDAVPEDLFGVRPYNKAKLKAPKEKATTGRSRRNGPSTSTGN